jgi:hypothetical protein
MNSGKSGKWTLGFSINEGSRKIKNENKGISAKL